jgi:hypothetical protein
MKRIILALISLFFLQQLFAGTCDFRSLIFNMVIKNQTDKKIRVGKDNENRIEIAAGQTMTYIDNTYIPKNSGCYNYAYYYGPLSNYSVPYEFIDNNGNDTGEGGTLEVTINGCDSSQITTQANFNGKSTIYPFACQAIENHHDDGYDCKNAL